MTTLLRDLLYSLRQMRKAPGFTTVAVITLALGIGANAAIFTLVHAILLQPLPVKEPSQLYRLGSHEINCCVIGGLQDNWDDFSYPLYLKLKEGTPELESLTAFQAGMHDASTRRAGDNSPARPMTSEYVSGNYFDMFGVGPFAGRMLHPSDDKEGAPPAAVMSYRAWQNYFASDPSVVGSTFTLNGTHFTVVGIAAPEFYGDRLSETPPDFWLPLATEPVVRGAQSFLKQADVHWLYLMGRLKPGASPAQVEAKVTTELQQWLNSPEGASTVGDFDHSRIGKQKMLVLASAGGVASLASNTEKGLRLLMALSGVVLLIACANVANLLLARGRRERCKLRCVWPWERGADAWCGNC